MKPLILISLLPLFLISCYNPNSHEIFHDLRVLDGNWESYKGVKFNENWRFIDDNLFEGEGFSLNGSDTSFFESLSIVRNGDSIYYRVFFDENNDVVDFLLTDVSKHSWTFTNPENDFPSIINYQIEDDTLLLVTIANIRGNKEQFFHLRKNK